MGREIELIDTQTPEMIEEGKEYTMVGIPGVFLKDI